MARSFMLLTVFLTGCAFTNIPVTLPTAKLDPSVSGGRGRAVIIDASFNDKRPTTLRVGMQKNGYNMDTADAICTEDPGPWIAKRIAEELAAAGFVVSTAGSGTAQIEQPAEASEAPRSVEELLILNSTNSEWVSKKITTSAGPVPLRVSGELRQLFIEPVIGFWTMSLEADLSVAITVSASGITASRTFYVKGTRKAFASTKGHYRVALERATEELVRNVVVAIVELADRESASNADRQPRSSELAWTMNIDSEGEQK